MRKIKVAICGYGNLGKGVEKEISKNPDMELVGIFSRRKEVSEQTTTKVFSMENIEKYKDDIDVVIMCGGSANDLEVQVPEFAKYFDTVDSFDTHAKIPKYFEKVDKAAYYSRHYSIISVGWDPGLFSINRLYGEAFLPKGETYTFWGKGVSQGHTNAIKRIAGVKDAVQYTIPKKEALESVRKGENPKLTTREKHLRECFVVAEDWADKDEIEMQIKTMANYFDEYDTVVNFISEEELKEKHSEKPHGGFVIRSGETGDNHKEIMEFSLDLDSNPEFTSSVLIAYARAVVRLRQVGTLCGARTVLDIPPIYLTRKNYEEVLKTILTI